jgi:hypothetical protein
MQIQDSKLKQIKKPGDFQRAINSHSGQVWVIIFF